MSNVAYASPAREVVSLELAHPTGEFPALVVDTRTAEHEADGLRFVNYLTRGDTGYHSRFAEYKVGLYEFAPLDRKCRTRDDR